MRLAGPAVIREGLSTTFLPAASGRSRAARRDRDHGRAMIRDLPTEEFAGRYGADRFTATVLANRFRYIVEHICSRLLTAAFSPILRDFYDFAATLTGPPARDYPTPAMSASIVLFTGTMTDSVRNTVEEYGPERLGPGDVIVANDPYRNGTHVNDLLFCARSSTAPARRLRQHEGPPARHGRRCSGRLQPHQAQRLRERPRALAARAVPRRRTGARDLEPDLRQRPLRRDPGPGHADDLRRPEARRAAAARDDRALWLRRGPRRDDLCLRRRRRADGRGAGGDPRRRLGGRGRRRLRRRRRRRGVPRARQGHQARRPRRGRLQRHLPPGPHVRSTPPRSTPRRPSAWRSSTSSTRGRRSRAAPGATSTSSSPRARWSARCRPTARCSPTRSRAR